MKVALTKFVDSTERLEDRQALLDVWMKAAKRICPSLAALLRICGAQLFSNAVGESNFSSVTRLLSDQRLRSGGKLLAAQLLALRARSWAQFKDPDVTKKATRPKGGISSYFPAAALPMGVALDQDEEDEEFVVVGDVGDVAAPSVRDAAAISSPAPIVVSASNAGTASSPSVVPTTITSTLPQRRNRGARMAAILSVLRVVPGRGRRARPNINLEADDENSDSDYEEESAF